MLPVCVMFGLAHFQTILEATTMIGEVRYGVVFQNALEVQHHVVWHSNSSFMWMPRMWPHCGRKCLQKPSLSSQIVRVLQFQTQF